VGTLSLVKCTQNESNNSCILHVIVTYWLTAAEAEAADNTCEMDICESSSLTAVASKSLDLSRSLTDKIAADADDSDDDDDDANAVATSGSHSIKDKQVVWL